MTKNPCVTKKKDILRTIRLKLFTENDQEDMLFSIIKMREMLYNWAIDELYDNWNAHLRGEAKYKILTKESLSERFKVYKKENPNDQISTLPVTTGIAKIAFKDASNSFVRWNAGLMKYGCKPKFHKTDREKKSYGIRIDSSYIINGQLVTEGIGCRLRIDLYTNKYDGYGAPYSSVKTITKQWHNPRIKYNTDGFYLTFFYHRDRSISELENIPSTEPIGIDVGVRNTFTLSTNEFFHQPDVTRLIEKIDILNAKIYKSYRVRKNEAQEKGLHVQDIPKTKKEKDMISRRNKSYRKIHNKIVQFYYMVINDIIKRNPEAIVIETIYVYDIQRKLSLPARKTVRNVYFYMIRYMIRNKCDQYGIPLYEVNDNYPSSKICNRCKCVNEKLHSQSIFVCPSCGYTVDRDINASLNLRDVYINGEKDNIRWWNGFGNKLILIDKLTKD